MCHMLVSIWADESIQYTYCGNVDMNHGLVGFLGHWAGSLTVFSEESNKTHSVSYVKLKCNHDIITQLCDPWLKPKI